MLSHFTCVWLFVTLWTIARQSPLSLVFSRQGYWRGFPCPPPGRSSQPRDWTWASCILCITGRFFSHRAIQEAPAKTWKHPKCPLIEEWIKRCGKCIQWNITQPWKIIKIMPPAATQLDLEIIILSEASHRKTNTSWHRLYEESKINNTNELIYRVEAGSQT